MIPIIVNFPPEVESTAQGATLMSFEKHLRELTGLDCRVFKDKMADDSKRRKRENDSA